ncbi:MAG: XkdF-like putative serine protease domain-containing protein [Pseudomonadota bacterium]
MVIKTGEKKTVTGVVYAPLMVDTDGEAMDSAEIERMAHRFLADGKTDRIDVFHNGCPVQAAIVESFISGAENPDFPTGAWVVTMKINDDNLWTRIKKGEINGFSWAGTAVPSPRSVPVSHPVKAEGTVEPSTDAGLIAPQDHALELLFDEQARIIPTFTEEAVGHRHRVVGATATESTIDHAHRMVIRP